MIVAGDDRQSRARSNAQHEAAAARTCAEASPSARGRCTARELMRHHLLERAFRERNARRVFEDRTRLVVITVNHAICNRALARTIDAAAKRELDDANGGGPDSLIHARETAEQRMASGRNWRESVVGRFVARRKKRWIVTCDEREQR